MSSSPAANFSGGMPGEPAAPVPNARSAMPQTTTRGPRIVRVKAHSVPAHNRVVRPKAPPKPPADPYAAAVNSAANLKYGPQLQATQQQIQNAQAGQVNAQNWYQDYQNTLVAQQAALAQQAQGLAKALGAYAPQAAQTGNAQADALAQQAAQSQHYLGQSFAGTEGQMAQNVANQFSTGLIPGAALRSSQVQQGLTNQIGQLQGQRGQLLGQEGDYKTQVRGQLQAATQKEADTQAGLQVKRDTLNYLSGNAQAKVKVQRTNARTQRLNATTNQQRAQTEDQKLQSANAKQRHDIMLSDKKFQLDQQKFGAAQAKDNYEQKHSLGPYKPAKGTTGPAAFTPLQMRKSRSDFRSATQGLKDAGMARPGNGHTAAQALQLNAIPGVSTPKDTLFNKVAALTAIWGGVDPGLAGHFRAAYGWTPPIHKGIK